MICIRLYEHPMRPDARLFEAASIGDWLLDHYGEQPAVNVQVFAGEPSAETEITGNVPALLANDCPEYVVLESPGAGLTVYEIFQIIVVVVSVAMALSATPPTMPDNVNRTQQSANNSLGNRENQLRVGQRVEDIYGTVLAIPSLLMPTYNKYISHRKFEYGYYCISRGYIDASEISDGDSLISSITGASAAVYWPFTSPNSGVDAPVVQIGDAITDQVITASRSIEVDGITLSPINQLGFTPGDTYTFQPDVGGDKIIQQHKAPNFNSLINPGDRITVAMGVLTSITTGSVSVVAGVFTSSRPGVDADWTSPFLYIGAGDTVTLDSVGSATYDGVYTVVSVVNGADLALMTVTAPIADSPALDTVLSVDHDYSGVYTVDGVGDGLVILHGTTWPAAIQGAATITLTDAAAPTEYTDWVTLPAADRTDVWVNIVAPNGLVKDDGGQAEASIDFELSVEKLDPVTLLPTGLVEILNGNLSGSVQTERAGTYQLTTSWVGPARARMRRTTPHDFDFSGTVIDEIKWYDLYSVTPVDREHFGNKTTLHTVTEATSRATAVKKRQLNCIASRLLPTFNGATFSGAFDSTGLLASGAIFATSKLVDIIAAVSLDPKIGARDLATEVDMNQIWHVQQQLDAWNVECGQFNYTFDTDNMSFEETIIAIANAGFCLAYRQSGKIRLALDRPQSVSTALFTHRNKKPRSETITRKFANDSDYDGVEFVYSDPDSLQSETITLPLDGTATKTQKFEIPGIRSFTQAWMRANREYAKLLGQRISIETSTTLDARSLLPNARIDIVDNTRFRSFDGEVVAQAGLLITLSCEVEFVPLAAHSVVLMRRDGSLQSITVTAGPRANQVLLAVAPSEAIVTSAGPDGVRTIFSFGVDTARGAQAYLVQEIDLSDVQYPTLRAVNYSDAYYHADALAVPDKAPIISGSFVPPALTYYLLTDDGGVLLTDAGDSFVQD